MILFSLRLFVSIFVTCHFIIRSPRRRLQPGRKYNANLNSIYTKVKRLIQRRTNEVFLIQLNIFKRENAACITFLPCYVKISFLCNDNIYTINTGQGKSEGNENKGVLYTA